MSVYIFQEEEPFAQIFENMRSRGRSVESTMDVRRPVRGLQVERDTYAYLKVVDLNNNPLPFLNAGALMEDDDGIGYSYAYSNFLLQKVQIARAELKQFVKTFGLTYLFLFGENPIMITVEGALVHSADFKWDEEWWANYESTLRATRLAEMGARVYLCYEGVLIEGYILNSTTARDANVRHLVPLGFEMVATGVKFLAKVGKTDFPYDKKYLKQASQVYHQGIDLHRLLPPNTRIQYDTRSQIAQLLSQPANLPGTGIAMASQIGVGSGVVGYGMGVGVAAASGRTPQPEAIAFGSFQALVRTIAEAPSLLAGLTSSSAALSAADQGLSAGTAGVPPNAVFGKINLNVDEYVALARPASAGFTTQGRPQTWNQEMTPDQDREVAGTASRLTTRPNPFDTDGGTLMENVYGSGAAPGAEPNLTTVDGLGGGSGIGAVEGEMVDDPEDYLGDLSGGRSDNPSSTTRTPLSTLTDVMSI